MKKSESRKVEAANEFPTKFDPNDFLVGGGGASAGSVPTTHGKR